jgi:S1-C subfamily serine protease/HEAT repeat protein
VGGLIVAALWLLPARLDVVEQSVAVAQPEEEPAAPAANPDPAPRPADPPPQRQQPVPEPVEPIKPAPQPEPGAAAGALPLKELKAATVYIKAETVTMGATGSGFVIRAQGDTAYVITNHHVVTPPRDEPAVPRLPFGPRVPFGPRLPFGPGLPMHGPAAAQLTVVFRSGTPQEQSLQAVVVGDDDHDDLAVLKVTGVKDVPRPIDPGRTPKLIETMPVLAFGFPFGADLDPKKGNPAVTVTKGAVSSLRQDGRGQLEAVQIDADINPGNSGGPVVDETGALVGVTVAKVRNSRIGVAIPVAKLSRLLEGRIGAPETLVVSTVGGRGTEVRIIARAADPLGRLRSPELLYGLAHELKMPARRGTGWDRLAGARSCPLSVEGARAVALLALTPPAKGEFKLLAQVTYQDAAGRTVLGEPRTLSLTLGAAPPAQPGPSKPPAGEELTKLLADLKAPDQAARQKAAEALAQAPPRERLNEVRPALRALLKDTDAATRAAAAKALAACDPKEAAPALARLLDDEVPAVRQAVLELLKGLKDPRVAEAVAARLPTDPLPAVEALKALGPAAEKAVLPYLTDKNATARFWAFNVIKDVGAAASVPPLEEILRANGPDAVHARPALQAVRERVPLTADEWPQALDDLKSPDAARRTGAVRRIAVTPPAADRRADILSRLESVLNDQSGDARAAAARAIARWGGKDAVPVLARRLEGFDPFGKVPIFDALAEIKDEAAAAVVAKRMPDVHDRGNAARTLKAIGPVAEKSVLPLLDAGDVFVRVEACKVLAEVGGRDSLGPLEQASKGGNVFLAPPATEALAAVKARLPGGPKN